MAQRAQRLFGVSIVPLLFFALAFQLPIDLRSVRFQSFNAIPYFFNGFLLREGEKIPLAEHPGFSFVFFSASIIEFFERVILQRDLSEALFLESIRYIYETGLYFSWVLIALSLFFFGWMAAKKFNLAFVIPAQFIFVASPSFLERLTVWKPELFLLPLAVLNALVLLGLLSRAWLPLILASLVSSRLNYLPLLMEIFLEKKWRKKFLHLALIFGLVFLFSTAHRDGIGVFVTLIDGALSVVKGDNGNEMQIHGGRLILDIKSNFPLLVMVLIVFCGMVLRELHKGVSFDRRVALLLIVIVFVFIQFALRPVHFRYLYPAIYITPVLYLLFTHRLDRGRVAFFFLSYFCLIPSGATTLNKIDQLNRDHRKSIAESNSLQRVYDTFQDCNFLIKEGAKSKWMDYFFANSAANRKLSQSLQYRYPNVYFGAPHKGFFNFSFERFKSLSLERSSKNCVVTLGFEPREVLGRDFRMMFPNHEWRGFGKEIQIGKISE